MRIGTRVEECVDERRVLVLASQQKRRFAVVGEAETLEEILKVTVDGRFAADELTQGEAQSRPATFGLALGCQQHHECCHVRLRSRVVQVELSPATSLPRSS